MTYNSFGFSIINLNANLTIVLMKLIYQFCLIHLIYPRQIH